MSYHNRNGPLDDDDGDGDGDGDGNPQRAFLQALLSRPTLTFPTAQTLISHIESAAHPHHPRRPEDITPATFESYILRANASLSPFDLEIRSAAHQSARGERVWALVNTTSDALTQMATLHGADEIAFVKRVLDAMFSYAPGEPEVMAVTGMQAMRLAKPQNAAGRVEGSSQMQATQNNTAAVAAALTLVQAEKVLENMVAEGWFEKSRKGFYSLSPRALMELRGWLIDTFNSHDDDEDDEDEDAAAQHDKIKLCAACRDIVTVGQRCPDLTCPARLHEHCVENKFRAQGGRQECPTCKVLWRDPPAVGERAAVGQGGHKRGGGSGARRSTNGGTMVYRGRSIEVHDDNDNDDDAENSSEE